MAHLLNRVVCVAEALTGLVLLANPSFVAEMLLGSDVTGAGVVISRIGGIALIGLGVSCWPGGGARGLQGMTIYNIADAAVGVLSGLQPACAIARALRCRQAVVGDHEVDQCLHADGVVDAPVGHVGGSMRRRSSGVANTASRVASRAGTARASGPLAQASNSSNEQKVRSIEERP